MLRTRKWAALSKLRFTQAFKKPARVSLSVFRSLHLQLFRQLTRWRTPHEPKKTALYQSRRAAVLHVGLHIIPLAAATSFLVLNINTFYIGSISTNGLTAMQFASKVLEILIQTSIATIVWAYVRHQALGPEGVPFGGLIAPFRAANVSSLWSLELWGCITSKNIDWKRRTVFCVSFFGAVVLAALVGPSSAVLMIPRLINFPRYRGLVLFDPMEDLFPNHVDASHIPRLKESDYNITLPQCMNALSDPSRRQVPIADETGMRNMQLDYAWGSADGLMTTVTTIATIPTRLTSAYLGTDLDFTTIRMPQPYVYVECKGTSYQRSSSYTYQYVDFGPETPDINHLIPLEWLLSNTSRPSNASAAILHTSSQEGDEEIDFAFVWRAPPVQRRNMSVITAAVADSPSEDGFYVEACIVGAYWATVTSNMTSNSFLTNEGPLKLADDPTTTLANLEDKVSISLDPAWCEQISHLSDVGNDAMDAYSMLFETPSALYALALSYVPRVPNTSPYQSVTLSRAGSERNGVNVSDPQWTALVDYVDSSGLRPKFDSIESYTDKIGTLDPRKLLQVEVKYYSTSYGYDSSTITVKLSLAVIMVYVTSAMIYLIYTLITGKVANSWNTTTELTVLALNSQKPKDLENASVGIDTLETFRRPVNIRVNQGDGSLEIVFDASEADGYGCVEANQKY